MPQLVGIDENEAEDTNRFLVFGISFENLGGILNLLVIAG